MATGYARLESLAKADRSKLSEYPSLSLKERDRRWGLIRKMMDENGAGALMVLPGGEMDCPSIYLTNSGHNLLFFPLQGEPVSFAGRAASLPSLLGAEVASIEPWVKWRYAEKPADEWVQILKERGLTKSRIGTVAQSHFSAPQQQRMAAGLTSSIRKALPEVEFVDLYEPFLQIFHVKSPEEIMMLRKAAAASEVLCEAYAEACKPGNTVADVRTAALAAVSNSGVNFRVEVGSGPDGSRGTPWLEAALKPPVLEKGDLVYSEVFAWVGSVHAQSQVYVSIGEPSDVKKKLADLCRDAYENALKIIRPGITFGELVEAMDKPNEREGAWKYMPNCHTLNPIEAVDRHPIGMTGPNGYAGMKERIGDVSEDVLGAAEGRPRRFDLVMREGCSIELEPTSCLGRTYAQIGGTVLVTKDGCEELNSITTHAIIVPA